MIERGAERDAMWTTLERRGDGESDVFRCRPRAKGAELADRIASTGDTIDEALTDQPGEQVRCSLRRQVQSCCNISGLEDARTSGQEAIDEDEIATRHTVIIHDLSV